MPLEFLPAENPINRVSLGLHAAMLATQQASARRAFSSPTLLCQAACDRARVTQDLATALEQAAISAVLDVPHRQLLTLLTPRARELGLSDSAVVKVADNVQLLRAFAKPDVVIEQVRAKVERIVDSFPRAAADLECGRNPGDVMDPFLLGATQFAANRGHRLVYPAYRHEVTTRGVVTVQTIGLPTVAVVTYRVAEDSPGRDDRQPGNVHLTGEMSFYDLHPRL